MKNRQTRRVLLLALAGLLAGIGFLRRGGDRPTPAPGTPVARAPAPAPRSPALLPAPAAVPGAQGLTEIDLAADAPRAETREALLELDPPMREWPREPMVTTWTFFDGIERQLDLGEHTDLDGDSGVFEGEVTGVPGSYVVLAYVDDAVAGTMFLPGIGVYRVRTRAGGELHFTEIDPASVPPESLPLLPPGATVTTDEGAAPAAPGAGGAPVVQADTASTAVTILVAYTPAASAANGGAAGVQALINASVATANRSYVNSQIAISLQLVQTVQTSYTESGMLATDLPRLYNMGDGMMDELGTARTSARADLVSLIVSSGTDAAGIAYLWTPGNTGFAPAAVSVVVDDYADANLTLAHEVGHNMGAGHAASDGGGGAYAYSAGWRFTAGGTTVRTVMAYAPGLRLPYFSNPDVSYLGVPTGTSTANNALTLMNSRTTVAAFQTGLTAADQQWTPMTAGDLNGDGKPDLVWRNSSTGRVIAWLMNGTAMASSAVLWSGDAAWVPAAAADLDADGQTDLVWRNSSTGRVIAWLMNGTTMASSTALWTGDPAWVPICAGDFNTDGKPDLVWRNSSTGRVIVWIMNGTTMTSSAALWTGDPAWVPIASGDWNGDGKTDLEWRNTSTGRVIAWLMDGTTMTSSAVLWSGAANWVPRAAGAFAGTSNTDLVWRNSNDGRVIIWIMNGATMASSTPIWQ